MPQLFSMNHSGRDILRSLRFNLQIILRPRGFRQEEREMYWNSLTTSILAGLTCIGQIKTYLKLKLRHREERNPADRIQPNSSKSRFEQILSNECLSNVTNGRKLISDGRNRGRRHQTEGTDGKVRIYCTYSESTCRHILTNADTILSDTAPCSERYILFHDVFFFSAKL